MHDSLEARLARSTEYWTSKIEVTLLEGEVRRLRREVEMTRLREQHVASVGREQLLQNVLRDLERQTVFSPAEFRNSVRAHLEQEQARMPAAPAALEVGPCC